LLNIVCHGAFNHWLTSQAGMQIAFSPETVAFGAEKLGNTAPAVARLSICDDLTAARQYWSTLLAHGAAATPYQSFGWIEAWHRHVSGPAGATPLVIVGFDEAGAPLLVIPLMVQRRRSLTIAGFFGEEHSNANMGLWRRDVAARVSAVEIRAMLAEVARRQRIDLYVLRNQPAQWEGCANPFMLLPRQPAPDETFPFDFHGLSGEQVLSRCISSSMRGRLRTKERKLQRLPGYRFIRATTAADVERFLEAFLTQKAAHFRDQGIGNVFAEPGIEAFLRSACFDGLDSGRPVIELHALECDAEVLSVFGGVNDGRRFSCMFNSYTTSENGRWSPGLIIITHIVAHCADRGLQSLDLGIGYAHYKTFFCKDPEQLFDAFLAGSWRGKAAATALAGSYRIKHRVKSSAALRGAMTFARRILAR
jgi:CelD/BcsL family acetyltransferase involved in cellulose biosynthesis